MSANVVRTPQQQTRDGINDALYMNNPQDCKGEMPSMKVAWRRVCTGLFLLPAIMMAPFYGIGFGVVGHKKMWVFSEWLYSFCNSGESWLHQHFSHMEKFLASGKMIAMKKSRNYRIHPTFAGLSLISTAVLAFVDPSKVNTIICRKCLLVANAIICFVSALSARALQPTMFGNLNAKRWNLIQGNLTMIFAALALSPSWLGNIMIHLNWSSLFVGGMLERLYVLCILSQFKINHRMTYVKMYSPIFQVATLGSIPIGIATFIMFGSILPK